MTTSEILSMAMRVAELGRTNCEPVKITIATAWIESRIADRSGAFGVSINVEPALDTESIAGTGILTMCGEGATIDAAALDLLQSVFRAEAAIRVRTAKRAEHGATMLAKLDEATGRMSR